jgi:hypothetical protein
VRARFPSHGAAHVGGRSRTPSAFAGRLRHVAIAMAQWPGRGGLSPSLWSREARIDVPHVSGVARVAAVGTSPALALQEAGASPGDAGGGTPAPPGDGLAIVGAAPPWPGDVPPNRRHGVATDSRPTGWRRDGPRPRLAPPVWLVAPVQGLVRLATPDPRAALGAQLCVPRRERLVTPDREAGVAPSSEHRGPRRQPAGLGSPPRSAPHGP